MPDIRDLVLFALTLGNLVANIALWLRKPGEDAGQAVQTLRSETRESISSLRGRADVMEERVKHMPTTDELTELEGQFSAIRERLVGLDDTTKNTRAAVQRIEDYLRRSGK
jgi:ElaB/YqjD/DUF883 family membrane-anchored ribosome-binding protein